MRYRSLAVGPGYLDGVVPACGSPMSPHSALMRSSQGLTPSTILLSSKSTSSEYFKLPPPDGNGFKSYSTNLNQPANATTGVRSLLCISISCSVRARQNAQE